MSMCQSMPSVDVLASYYVQILKLHTIGNEGGGSVNISLSYILLDPAEVVGLLFYVFFFLWVLMLSFVLKQPPHWPGQKPALLTHATPCLSEDTLTGLDAVLASPGLAR